jgi:hypothetical protein
MKNAQELYLPLCFFPCVCSPLSLSLCLFSYVCFPLPVIFFSFPPSLLLCLSPPFLLLCLFPSVSFPLSLFLFLCLQKNTLFLSVDVNPVTICRQKCHRSEKAIRNSEKIFSNHLLSNALCCRFMEDTEFN